MLKNFNSKKPAVRLSPVVLSLHVSFNMSSDMIFLPEYTYVEKYIYVGDTLMSFRLKAEFEK